MYYCNIIIFLNLYNLCFQRPFVFQMEPANDERLTSEKPAVNLFEYLKTSRGSVQSSSDVLIKCHDGVLQLILPSISSMIPEPKVEQFDASDVVDTVMKEELDSEEENSPTIYKCRQIYTTTRQIYTNIDAMNLQYGNIKCSFCVKCGENISGGRKGLESHHKRFHKSQICTTCGVEVKGWQNMHQHKRQCEKKTCENCFKEIPRKTFSRHFKACTGAGEGVHSCDHCDYKTYRKDQLKR